MLADAPPIRRRLLDSHQPPSTRCLCGGSGRGRAHSQPHNYATCQRITVGGEGLAWKALPQAQDRMVP
ncbi:MAG: hypothetical protein DMD87_06475 [Candidatus Rokuibacteriota bacterium]|nr:MAG: hypothetical protein DMD87_06475 [Candidatus Rokubacteria bacterium]